MLLTHNWFDRNIEYGQRDWYCFRVEMDKEITTDMHGPWHELPSTDSVLVDATSTAIPNEVEKSPTPMKTKKV